MTEMQAAIGRLQLKKLREWLDIRRRHAAFLNECFAGIPGLHVGARAAASAMPQYRVLCFLSGRTCSRADGPGTGILQAIVAEGLPCFTSSCPEIYWEKAFAERIKPKDRFRVARGCGRIRASCSWCTRRCAGSICSRRCRVVEKESNAEASVLAKHAIFDRVNSGALYFTLFTRNGYLPHSYLGWRLLELNLFGPARATPAVPPPGLSRIKNTPLFQHAHRTPIRDYDRY